MRNGALDFTTSFHVRVRYFMGESATSPILHIMICECFNERPLISNILEGTVSDSAVLRTLSEENYDEVKSLIAQAKVHECVHCLYVDM